MLQRLLLLGLAASIASAQYGTVSVFNYCNETVYLWSISNVTGLPNTIPTDSSFFEASHKNPAGKGGIQLAITKVPNGINIPGTPTLNLPYTIDDSHGDEDTVVWYDLTTDNGSPFVGHDVYLSAQSDADDCPYIEWESGEKPPGNSVAKCVADADLLLQFCPEEEG